MLLSVIVYVHHFIDETDSNCLAPFVDQWPRNGVLRVEVVRNLKKFNAYQDRLLGKIIYLLFLDTNFSIEQFLKNIQSISSLTRGSVVEWFISSTA